jgi:hypothetical protein
VDLREIESPPGESVLWRSHRRLSGRRLGERSCLRQRKPTFFDEKAAQTFQAFETEVYGRSAGASNDVLIVK